MAIRLRFGGQNNKVPFLLHLVSQIIMFPSLPPVLKTAVLTEQEVYTFYTLIQCLLIF